MLFMSNIDIIFASELMLNPFCNTKPKGERTNIDINK